ncbi:DUF6111 family protein [Hirschia litorea]|uniref:DUF6111 family protein n=1 Tax=Hirschia litorea TaxID=1199156 RepID=A0ABW2IKA7_9PROT
MTRRILIELALFSIPFLVFFMYRAASKDLSIKDRWPLTGLIVVGGVLAVGGMLIKAITAPSDKGLCFQAARYENRVFIPAAKVPCDQVIHPENNGATKAARDNIENEIDIGSTARKLPTVMEPEQTEEPAPSHDN